VTASGKSQTVSELRELLGDVEGLEIGIQGGKVYVGGEIVVPSDITRVNTVLETYQEILRLVQLSPQTQRVIARKMMDELARNNLKDVTVRVVNRVFWLEGVVSSQDKKNLAVAIANAYLPDRIALDPKGLQTVKRDDIIDFISVNEKKDPAPPPKQVKITSQFVELSKDYSRIFGFKWAPLMNEDQSSISFGQQTAGGVTSSSDNTLAATISNLFPKLNSARSAGYARIVQSGMVITKDKETAKIDKQTEIPFAVGSGDFTRPQTASVGFSMEVTPKVLEQEKVEMGIGINVSLSANTSAGSAPATTKNNIKTTVVIKSKESAAIGGIVQNQTTTAYDKDDPAPSGGGDGPPPQALFRILRSKNHQISRSQYVMFLTPEIIESATAGTEEIRKKFRRRTR
ncbi:MAG: type II secretion system protein GspD, partial [Bacteroidota bacterium]